MLMFCPRKTDAQAYLTVCDMGKIFAPRLAHMNEILSDWPVLGQI